MTSAILSPTLSLLLLAQAGTPVPSPAPPVAAPAPAPMLSTPTDGFGPDLKAWIDATKLQDQESARKALLNLQRLRADRNLSSVDDVAAVISGRAEARGVEGSQSEAAEALASAAALDPGSASILVSKAAAEGKVQDAWGALSLSASNPFEAGRVRAFRLLTALVIGGLFALGFALALLLRYAAVFSHDVAEGLPQALKSFALAMAVLFLALPLAGLLGWGYLPFWWAALLFIFQSRAEKAVSLVLLVGLSLASLALPLITHQRAINAAASARPLHKVANGGISVEGVQLVKERLAQDPTDLDWSLLSAGLSRRAGRFEEADALLQPRAGADPRFAHNVSALALNRGDFARALPGFAQAAEAPLSPQDRATAFYNLSLAQVNTLAFDASKESRAKGEALDSELLARYDRLFSFDRDGSTLQAAPDIVPAAPRLMGAAIPNFAFTAENSLTRLTAISLTCLLLIPAIMKLRGARSFSKQCPKCGTTFCWMCQTRSTSQDVCSQCHHLFVVKRGIPPATRAAKTAEISRFVTLRSIQHRVASLLAPGSGHLSVGHFTFGIVILFVWALSAGVWLSVSSFAPLLLASGPLAPMLKNVFLGIAVLSYGAAQAVTPRPPVIVTPRRVREAEA